MSNFGSGDDAYPQGDDYPQGGGYSNDDYPQGGGYSNDDYMDSTLQVYYIYMAYFAGMILLAYILDRCGIFDNLVIRIGASAHKSFMMYEYDKIKGIQKEDKEKEAAGGHSSRLCCCNSGAGDNAVLPEDIDTDTSHREKNVCVRVCLFRDREVEYNPLFIKKLLSKKSYYGSTDELVCCLCCATGIFGDFLFYLFNHHSFLSTFSASKKNGFDRGERRVAYYVQHVVAFTCAAAVTAAGLDNLTKLMMNIFVITPFTLFVNTSFYYLLACPCLIREYQWSICRICSSWCECCGAMIAYPLAMTMFGVLFCAALLTTNDDYAAMAKYAYQVHVISMFTDFFLATIMFRKNTYTKYSICGKTVLEFGTWFKEQAEIFDLEEETGYNVTISKLCFLSVTQWHRIPGIILPPPSAVGDIEMATNPKESGTPQVMSVSAHGAAPVQEQLIAKKQAEIIASYDPRVAEPEEDLTGIDAVYANLYGSVPVPTAIVPSLKVQVVSSAGTPDASSSPITDGLQNSANPMSAPAAVATKSDLQVECIESGDPSAEKAAGGAAVEPMPNSKENLPSKSDVASDAAEGGGNGGAGVAVADSIKETGADSASS